MKLRYFDTKILPLISRSFSSIKVFIRDATPDVVINATENQNSSQFCNSRITVLKTFLFLVVSLVKNSGSNSGFDSLTPEIYPFNKLCWRS